MKKIRVALLFGGKSTEHEVSLRSAKNVIDALDPEQFEPVLIGIDKQGVWHQSEPVKVITAPTLQQLTTGTPSSTALSTLPTQPLQGIDVVFPILHGPLGEDGTVQGLLRLAGIPFVGADVLGSAIGMDKDVMKRLLRDAGIPIAPFLVFRSHQQVTIDFDQVKKELGLPLFIKPANAGSSVGVSKATTERQFNEALHKAFLYDEKILIESGIIGDEIECAVLGNNHPQASLPGKIIPHADFYSYEAKYTMEDGAAMEIPAKLSPEIIEKIQAMAIKTFQVLECMGMGRIDMFLTPDGEILVNEINTIPGFTSKSMYPKLWEASGVSYSELITKLLKLALERFANQQQLTSSYKENSLQ